MSPTGGLQGGKPKATNALVNACASEQGKTRATPQSKSKPTAEASASEYSAFVVFPALERKYEQDPNDCRLILQFGRETNSLSKTKEKVNCATARLDRVSSLLLTCLAWRSVGNLSEADREGGDCAGFAVAKPTDHKLTDACRLRLGHHTT